MVWCVHMGALDAQDSDKKDTFADNLHNQIREAMLGCGYDIVVEDEYNMVFTTQPSPEPALSQQRLRGTAEAGRNWVLGAGSNLLRVDAQVCPPVRVRTHAHTRTRTHACTHAHSGSWRRC